MMPSNAGQHAGQMVHRQDDTLASWVSASNWSLSSSSTAIGADHAGLCLRQQTAMALRGGAGGEKSDAGIKRDGGQNIAFRNTRRLCRRHSPSRRSARAVSTETGRPNATA